MAKDIETINREFAEENYLYYEPDEQPNEAKDGEESGEQPKGGRHRSRGASIVSDIVFYGCLVMMLIGVFVYSQSNNGSVNILGFRLLEPLTTSMQSVYPQGSLLVVSTGNLQDIEAGDDITFMVSAEETATHRCIEVIENYEGGGMTAYRTQGVDNPLPDSGVVYQNNVVGKVVLCVPYVGSIMTFIAERFLYIFVVFVALIVLSFGMKMIWGETGTTRKKRRAIKALQRKKRQAEQKF